VQAYGPHVDYLSKILADAGLTPKDVTIRWTQDLTGQREGAWSGAAQPAGRRGARDHSRRARAYVERDRSAPGAEDSVKGARILLSTEDREPDHRRRLRGALGLLRVEPRRGRKFVQGLIQGEDALRKLVANKASRAAEFKDTMSAAARELLDSPQAISDTEGMYKDAEFAGVAGNSAFFTKADNPRSFAALNKEIQTAFSTLGLVAKAAPIDHAGWDYRKLGAGADVAPAAEARRFDAEKVATMVARKQSQGKLQEGELFSFEVFFKPNQDKFTADLYGDAFKKVASLAATYGGAIITGRRPQRPDGVPAREARRPARCRARAHAAGGQEPFALARDRRCATA
jgi:hypothetical protein